MDGVEGRDGGRGQTVHYIDWEHPERNDFLAINQFRVDEPGGQAHKYVVPDIVLFVNGIPLVVIECKSPYVTEPAVEAIDQLQRYANQRSACARQRGQRATLSLQPVRGRHLLRQGDGRDVHRRGRALRRVEGDGAGLAR